MRGELRILDRTGHKAVPFDTDVSDGPLDPAYAEAEFNRMVAGGAFFGFGTDVKGDSTQLKQFDPTFPQVTLSPRFVGG